MPTACGSMEGYHPAFQQRKGGVVAGVSGLIHCIRLQAFCSFRELFTNSDR